MMGILLGIISEPNLILKLLRGLLLGALLFYFAIKWQKKNKPQEEKIENNVISNE